jgi:hypothetical protein
MMVAKRPQTEAEGQIENLKDLREVIEAGDTKLALDWIDAAIKLLAGPNKSLSRTEQSVFPITHMGVEEK